MTQTYNQPMKKPSGCLHVAGILLTLFSALFILLCVLMIFVSEDKMNENRAVYAAAQEEYEQALEAYEADSVHIRTEVARIQESIYKAEQDGDTVLAAALTDSLKQYAAPEFVHRGAIGFNIGGAFFLFFAFCALVPLVTGVVLIVIYRKKRKQYHQLRDQMSVEAPL